jgi:ubiquinone biosynthesis protein
LELVKQRYSPERLGNDLMRGMEQLSRAGYDLPLQLREVLEDVRLGRLTVRTEDPKLPSVADRLGRRVFSGLVAAGFAVGGATVLQADERSLLGITLLVLSCGVALLHVVRDRRYKEKAP